MDLFSETKTYISEFPREIYAVYILKLLDSYTYFAISQILVIYLHDEFNVVDITSGAVYGLWLALITLFGIMLSWLNDVLGVRRAAIIGFCTSCMATLILTWTESLSAVYLALLLIYPLGESVGPPMLTVAIRRCTTETNRGFAFGLFYSVMNVGALLAGPIVDVLNMSVPKVGIQVGNKYWSGNRFVLFSCFIASVISVLVAIFLLKDHKIEETSSESVPQSNVESNAEHKQVFRDSKSRTTPFAICASLLSSPTLWRFTAVTLLLVNLQAIFLYMDATLPTFLVRLYGHHAPKGTLYSINPFIIVFLTPVVAAYTSKFNHFNMIKYGGFITGLAPFFLAAVTSIWSAAAMITFISLGEALWSPRLYDYVMSIAPEGKEATFSSLSSIPSFLAQIPFGLLSGYLLGRFCSEDPNKERHPRMLWLIIGLLTISSPIMITVFDKWVREPSKLEKNDDGYQLNSLQSPSQDMAEKSDWLTNLCNKIRKDKSNSACADNNFEMLPSDEAENYIIEADESTLTLLNSALSSKLQSVPLTDDKTKPESCHCADV